MMNKLSMIGAALAMTAGATIAAAPAHAQYYGGNGYGYAQGGRFDRGYDNRGWGRGYNDRSYNRGFNNRRGYVAQNYYGGNRGYYGGNFNNNYRCRSNGTTGTVLGAVVGGLLGDAVVGRRGDGTAGAIVGAGVGALAGRAIERGNNRC